MNTRSFPWIDYLTLAKTLAASREEAALRTSISRSYYFALHFAEDSCRTHGVLIPQEILRRGRIDRSIHARVITALTRHGDRHLQQSGKLLDNLRGWRNGADYESRLKDDIGAMAKEAIAYADGMRTELDIFGRER